MRRNKKYNKKRICYYPKTKLNPAAVNNHHFSTTGKKTRPNPVVEKNISLAIRIEPLKLKEELNSSNIISASSLLIHDYILRTHSNLRSRNSQYVFPGPRLFNSPEPMNSLPTIVEIQAFIQAIFDKRRLPMEAGIIAIILLNRTSIKIHSENWMRLVLMALLLANKLCEDVYSVYNAKFLGLIPNLENLEINILELEFLQILKYRLFIDTETYLRYYAKLQNLCPEVTEKVSSLEMADSLPTEEEEISDPVGTIPEDVGGEMMDICSNPVENNGCGSYQDFNFELVVSLA